MSPQLARLLMFVGTEQKQITLQPASITFGRGFDNHLVINESVVSRYHARIDRTPAGYTLTDLKSANGTRLNGQPIPPESAIKLTHGDRVEVGSVLFSFLQEDPVSLSGGTVVAAPADASQEPQTLMAASASFESSRLKLGVPPETLTLRGRNTFTIGRDPKNDLAIDHPTVSRFHARIDRRQGDFVVTDLTSSNGTYINGQGVKSAVLRVNDDLRIGPCSFVLNLNETLTQNFEEGNLRLDAFQLRKVVGKNVQLLNDISLSILPREFVAFLGASGSGKSTLLDALNGLRPASGGTVSVNGINLYQNFHSFATQMGYVPQQNIMHEDLTVGQALSFAAQMRMPPDTTLAERQQRIAQVLDDIGLAHRREVAIKLLSGGQQRRVAIGVELLNKPSLFFLDEATSGLDPGTEADMMLLLRQLADQGRTVMLITHATQNVRVCDLVLYLAEGGRIAYFGPPDQMLDYFRTNFASYAAGFNLDDFSGIYRFLDPEKNANAPSPEVLEQTYRRSPFFQQYIINRQQEVTLEREASPTAKRRVSSLKLQRPLSGFRQFWILSQRNLAVLARDRTTLATMIGIAPGLGLLDFFTWKSDIFSIEKGSATQAITMLFVSALIAVMIGEITTMRELVKENEIYKRERLYGLQLVPYVFSKVWIALLFALFQGLAYLIVKAIAVHLPAGFDVFLNLYFDFTIAVFAGSVLGLLVSALAPNESMAPLIMIMVLVPQIIFSGGMQPASNFGPPGQVLNRVNVIKWPFELLATHTGIGRKVAQDPCLKLTSEERDKLSETELAKCQCFGPNLFKTCPFPGIQTKYVPEIDQPKPVQPTTKDPTQLKDWLEKYQNWETKRRKAISEAEGVIEKTYEELGYLFNVNVPRHFAIEGFIILCMLVALPFVQKRKDAV
jgi:ABC transport system ATP-binding/permease protein